MMPAGQTHSSRTTKHLATRMFLFLCVALCVFVVWGGESERIEAAYLTPEEQLTTHINSLSDDDTNKCLISKANENKDGQGVVTCFPLQGTHADWNIITYSIAEWKEGGAPGGTCGSNRNHCALDFYPAEDTTPQSKDDYTYKTIYNQAIYAVWSGTVTYRGVSGDCGNSYRIMSKPEQTGFTENITIEICHIDQFSDVKLWDQVRAGTYLGTTGASGIGGNRNYWKNKSGSHLHIRFVRNYTDDSSKRAKSIPEWQLMQWPIFAEYHPTTGSLSHHLYYCGQQSSLHYTAETRNTNCNTGNDDNQRITVNQGDFDNTAGPVVTVTTRPDSTTVVSRPHTPPPDITELFEEIKEEDKYIQESFGSGKHIEKEDAQSLEPCETSKDKTNCLCDCTTTENDGICVCPGGKVRAKTDDGKWVCKTSTLKLQVDWMPLDNQSLNAVSSPGEVVSYLFRLMLYAGVILAFLSLLVAGIMYMLSSAAPDLRKQALVRVRKIFTGLIILLLSYLILGFISPSITQTGIPSLTESTEQDECSIDNEPSGSILPNSHAEGVEYIGKYTIMPLGRIIRDFYVTMQVENGECAWNEMPDLPKGMTRVAQVKDYLRAQGFLAIKPDPNNPRCKADPKNDICRDISLEEWQEEVRDDIIEKLGETAKGEDGWIEYAKKCGNLPYALGGLVREETSEGEVSDEPDKWGVYRSSTILTPDGDVDKDAEEKHGNVKLEYGGIQKIINESCGERYCRPPPQVTCRNSQPTKHCDTIRVCGDNDKGERVCEDQRRTCDVCGYKAASCCPPININTSGYENTCIGNVFGMEPTAISELINDIENYQESTLSDIAITMEEARISARECEENNGILYSCASLQGETGNVDDYNCDKLYIKDRDDQSIVDFFLDLFRGNNDGSGTGLSIENLEMEDLNNKLQFFCGDAENNHIYTHDNLELPVGKIALGPVFDDESDSIILRETRYALQVIENEDETNINITKHLDNIQTLLDTIKGRTCDRTRSKVCSMYPPVVQGCPQPNPRCIDNTDDTQNGHKACEKKASEILDTAFDLSAQTEGNAKLTLDLQTYQQTMIRIIEGLRNIADEIQNDEIATRTNALMLSVNRDIEEYLKDQCGDDHVNEDKDCDLDEGDYEDIQKKLEQLDQELPYIADILSRSNYVDPARTCVEMKAYIQNLKRQRKYIPADIRLHCSSCDGKLITSTNENIDTIEKATQTRLGREDVTNQETINSVEDISSCVCNRNIGPKDEPWVCTPDVHCCPNRALEKKIDACEPMDLFKCKA